MVERLQQALTHIDQLPPDEQEEIAAHIEEVAEAYAQANSRKQRRDEAMRIAGAWRDINWDDMERELDRMRHATPPSRPLDI